MTVGYAFRICTIVWLHLLDFNEVLWEKAWWKLHEDDTYCFEQILLTASKNTTAARSLASHFTNHSKTNMTIWTLLVKWTLQWAPTHGHTSVGPPAKINMHLCGYWMPSRGRANSDEGYRKHMKLKKRTYFVHNLYNNI